MMTNPMTSPPKSPATKTASPDKPGVAVDLPRRHRKKRASNVLRFSPTAWAKILHFRDHGQTEIGGFGITPDDDLLYVQDFATVEQEATMASIAFDDEAVADFFDRQVDAGLQPCQFGRIWCHTHPGESPCPSATDEETFERVFGSCQHAVMFILANGGQSYARLRFNVGPGGDLLIPVEVDYSRSFGASDVEAWEAEYAANIHPARGMFLDWDSDRGYGLGLGTGQSAPASLGKTSVLPQTWMEELEKMEPAERAAILEEFAAETDFWAQEEDAYVFD